MNRRVKKTAVEHSALKKVVMAGYFVALSAVATIVVPRIVNKAATYFVNHQNTRALYDIDDDPVIVKNNQPYSEEVQDDGSGHQ